MSKVPDEPFEQSGVTLFKHFQHTSTVFCGLCARVCVESFNKNKVGNVFGNIFDTVK